jgi:adenylate kinase
MSAIRAVVIMGMPGSGKGTQGEALGTLPGVVHFEMGEALRDLDPASDTGREVQAIMRRGALVPTELVVQVWRDRMNEWAARGALHRETDLVLLDGVPRSVEQARAFEPHIDLLGVVHLQCEDEGTLMDRIAGRRGAEGRSDDRNETVRERFRRYRESTRPLLDHYGADLVRDVDACLPPLGVLAATAAAVDDFARLAGPAARPSPTQSPSGDA